MPFNFLGGIVSGAFQLGGAYRTANAQERMNDQNVKMQKEINQANLEHSNYWNQMNYDLATKAYDAQMRQQHFENNQYLLNRDYERALQQEIFNREDTAIQRAMQDATSAGYSPLAALGMPANAGQVVSSSGTPGSVVSNNQASVQGAGQVAPHVEAVTGLGQGLSSIGNLVATISENMDMREYQKQMQQADFAQRLKEMDKTHFADKVMAKMEHDFDLNLQEQEHLYDIAEIIQNGDVQRQLQDVVSRHQLNMQTSSQQHDKDMLQAQQDFLSSNENNQGSGRGLHDVVNDIIDIVSQGDGKLAKWLRNNNDIITLIIEGLEIGLDIGDNFANTQSQRDVNQSQIFNNMYK